MTNEELKSRTLTLLQLLSYNSSKLQSWNPTIRACVRRVAEDEINKYNQAMDALRLINMRSDELSTELDSSKIRDEMRKFVKISDAILASETGN